MRVRKLWFVLCMSICLMFTLQACISTAGYEKAKPAINKELDNLQILSDDLKQAFKDHKAGTLTTEELGALTTEIRDSVKKSKDAIIKLNDESVGWGSMILATITGLLSRGIPSKGPLAMLFNVFTARRTEK